MFGKKKKKVSVNDRIAKNQDVISTLEKREQLLQKKIDNELKKAKAFIKRKNKAAAKQCILRKKNYDKQRSRLVAQMTNLENINMKLEEASIETDVFKAQKLGARDLKKLHGKMGTVDDIEESLDDIRDTMADAEEFGDALSQNIGSVGVDDADIMDELDDLEKDDLDEQLMGLEGQDENINLNVPVGEIKPTVPVKANEEDELAALEAELS